MSSPPEKPNILLHRGIKNRRRLFGIVLTLMSVNALYQVIFARANIFSTIAAFIVGFALGLFLISRMNRLSWDEHRGQIVATMDLSSIAILIGYIVFVLVRETLLARRFVGSTLEATSASIVAGIMVGQLIVLRRKIEEIIEPSERN